MRRRGPHRQGQRREVDKLLGSLDEIEAECDEGLAGELRIDREPPGRPTIGILGQRSSGPDKEAELISVDIHAECIDEVLPREGHVPAG